MILSIISWDGYAINDITNFEAYLPRGSFMLGSKVENNYLGRASNAPVYTSTLRLQGVQPLHIKLKGTVHSQMDTLRQKIDVTAGEKKLLMKDTANSDKQWYVMGTAKEFTELDGQQATVLIDFGDGILYAETATTTAWEITSSGDTQVVANAGNYRTAPIIRLTPTAAKTGGTAGANLYTSFWAVHHPSAYAAPGLPYDICNNAWDTAALIADNSNKAELNGGINNSVTTIPIDTVTGTIPTSGMGVIDTEQISWTGYAAGDLTGVTRGIGGTSAASHLDNAELKLSYMQYDGRDIRVYIDGVLADRWLDDWNTNNSSVWIASSWAANYLGSASNGLTLTVAIAASGAISTITVTSGLADPSPPTSAFWPAWSALPSQGLLQIDDEIFSYTSKTGTGVIPVRFGGVTREVKGSAEAAHTVGDQVKWIQHDITATFGDASASAPVIPTSREPMIDMPNSTNTSHVWASFYDSTGTRPLAWSASATVPSAPLNTSHIYTANQNTSANPATDMGGSIESFLSGGSYQSPAGTTLRWTISHPLAVSTVTATGEKKRVAGTWPTVRFLQGGGVMWTEASPGSGGSFGAWSAHTTVAAITTAAPTSWTFEMAGSVATSNGALAQSEAESVTFALNSSYVPAVTKIMTAPAPASGANVYAMDGILANDTNGDSVRVRFDMDIDETLEIDCANHVITYLKDNSPAFNAVIPSDEDSFDWITLDPGNNTLSWTEVGVTAVTGSVVARDRMI